jgi:hypothetical protein
MSKHMITARTGERFARLCHELETLGQRLTEAGMDNEARSAHHMASESRAISDAILDKTTKREQ